MKLLVVLFLAAGVFSACSKAEAEGEKAPKCSADGKCVAPQAALAPEKKCKCTENGGKCECPNGECKCTENGGTCECAK